jgi:hypothetical protein
MLPRVSFGPTVQTPHIDAISILPDRNVRLTVSGSSNVLYSVQGSASLAPSAWTSLVTNSDLLAHSPSTT